MDRAQLNNKLINHYNCFNTERFYLDEFVEKTGFVSIVTSSIADTCPPTLCKNIAKYIKRLLKKQKIECFIYVGAYALRLINYSVLFS